MKKNNEYGTIITRKHPTLNFGQTVDIIKWNEASDQVVIKPHGDSKTYVLNFNEVWPAHMTKSCSYDILNKDLEKLGEFDYIKH
jgi:hypothetical protein